LHGVISVEDVKENAAGPCRRGAQITMTIAFPRIRIVLVQPSHPGNIGAAARAMKTMGLSRLVLVAPKAFPHAEATALAAGADDVLDQARIVATMTEAVADCALVLGCTARKRGVALPELAPRAAAERLVIEAVERECALVFGNERTGLDNDDLQRCQAAVHIPTDADFGSLNLAAAVQVLSYELRVAALSKRCQSDLPAKSHSDTVSDAPATLEELEGYFDHLQRTLAAIDFFKGRAPDTIMRRLRRLYHRAMLTQREVLILRGVLSDAQRMARLAADRTAGPGAS
jgi:tRNA (cytidine32/uridine32-2'-O)-methyltransferase